MKALLVFLCLLAAPLLPARDKPNIVFILADDLGYGDLGCYGQEKIKTPRLDQMAREGLRYTSHYSGHNVCSPSRCALMTGRHMGHASVTGNGGRLRTGDVTVAMLLKKAGYRTCMIGKWGLVGRPGHPGSPNQKGFDHFFGFDNQGFAHFYYPEYLWRNDRKVLYPKNHDLRVNGEYKKGVGTYSHDELTSEAINWIKTNKKAPFFLYLPYCIPHAELTVPQDSMEPYLKLGWKEKPKIAGVARAGDLRLFFPAKLQVGLHRVLGDGQLRVRNAVGQIEEERGLPVRPDPVDRFPGQFVVAVSAGALPVFAVYTQGVVLRVEHLPVVAPEILRVVEVREPLVVEAEEMIEALVVRTAGMTRSSD